MAAMVLCASAQNDVTEFLGIPVDGAKAAMIQKLKAKGFRVSPHIKDALTGRFNGRDVNVYIGTNKNKVYRIMVCDADVQDAASIKIRFNNLCQQFKQNSKYISVGNELIPDEEDISIGIMAKNKRYEAVFYQMPKELKDTLMFFNKINDQLMPVLKGKYTEEELANPTEEMKKEYMQMFDEHLLGLSSKKQVWFMIAETTYGQYYITMFYDNKNNDANGEDL